MKSVIAMLAITLAAGLSQARTVCSIAGESRTQKGQYDRSLYVGDLRDKALFLVSKDGNSVTELSENWDESTMAKLIKANGQAVVHISQQDVGITLMASQVVVGKASQDLWKMKAMAFGTPAGANKPFALFSPEQGIAITCVEL